MTKNSENLDFTSFFALFIKRSSLLNIKRTSSPFDIVGKLSPQYLFHRSLFSGYLFFFQIISIIYFISLYFLFELFRFIFFFKLYLSFTLLSFCLLFFWFFFYFLSWDFPYNRIIYHMIFNIFYINF